MQRSLTQTIYHNRIRLISGIIALVFILLFIRLWYIQITRSEYYLEKAEKNRLRIVKVPAPRGLILDRKGRVLAENEATFSLILSREYIKNRDKLLDVLEKKFGLEKDQMKDRLREYRSIPVVLPVTMKNRLSFEEIAFVEAHKQSFPELDLDTVPTRRYVYNLIASHVLGYVGEITADELKKSEFADLKPGDIIGKIGLERKYNSLLNGKKGVKRIFINSIGQVTGLLDETPAEKGTNLTLSLDLDLQCEAEQLMSEKTGALVAINPKTGGILCLVSKPSFDPNLFTGHLTMQKWKKLIENPDKPLQNKAIQGAYAPGSIYKVLVALAALGEGVITPRTSFHCGGQTVMYGRTVHCWFSGGHGQVRLLDAITNSCNIYFYNIGLLMGIDKLHEWSLKAGFGRRTGIDLPGERSGLIPSSSWKKRVFNEKWYPGETISVVIGQGAVSVTPLQIASFMSAIAYNCEPPVPTLILNNEINNGSPGNNPLFPPSSHQIVVKGMENVVKEGTGKRAALANIRVAGKTGTAQIISTKTAERLKDYKKQFQEHAWFACFAPVEDAEIALVVIVAHGGHGGESAAPIAAGVMRKFFELYPPETKEEILNAG